MTVNLNYGTRDYAQKKSLQETTQWVETFSEEVFAFLFVCLFRYLESIKEEIQLTWSRFGS